MSILIPGMEMPKEDGALCIIIHHDGKVCHFFDLQGEQIATAVPVPPHGRLIDADALGIREEEKRAYDAYLREKAEFFREEPLLEYKRGRLEGLTDASGRVRFAPTIIPADPAEEGEG